MELTEELVARTRRAMHDPGPLPGLAYQSAEDYDAMVNGLLQERPTGQPVWLFAFGSLIWKPECEHLDEMRGTAYGWRRSFCFEIRRFRATPDCPGLMMSLDRGGQCQGMLYRLAEETVREQLHKLCRREITIKPANTYARWVTVDTEAGSMRAIAFVMNRKSPAYVRDPAPEHIARVLAQACGHWGSGAEYLFNTIRGLQGHGIHDRYLWRLQSLVARQIITGGAIPAHQGDHQGNSLPDPAS
ncbi:gamma-glutamylcyclotransferase [Noviherbaspirillum galbum]|nr:gamma-glutamylcyclotransferase [Noviherbaspirillum galbum]